MEQTTRTRHVCREGASPAQRRWSPTGTWVGKDADQFRPLWGEPGELTKLADEDRWGRVELIYTCCGERQVRLAAFDEHEAEVRRCWIADLENPWDDYPASLPPRGYPVPKRWPSRGEEPFTGARS